LRNQGLYDNALIAVAADHGESLGEHGELTHSIFLYDSTIHVPLLLKLLGNRFAGQHVNATASLVDLAPTLLEALGHTPPSAMQGRSLLPLIGDPHPENRTSFATGDHSERSFGWSALVSLRTSNQLFVRAPSPELYDLASDRGEKTNLYRVNRAAALRLASQLDNFVKRISTGAPQALQDGLDEKSREQLSALGYAASAKPSPPTRIDPKDRIDVANDMHDASLAIEEGKEATVIPLLLRVVAKDPQIQAAQYYLGIAYSRKGNFAQAIPPLRKAIELRTDALMAQYELAICLYETGDLKTAASHFEILVENRPDWSDARYSLASIYARTGRPEEAAKNLLVVLQGEPDHYRANLLLGRMLFLNGTFVEALPYLEKAASVEPKSVEAHQFLSEAYAKLGQEENAAREHAEAERLRAPR